MKSMTKNFSIVTAMILICTGMLFGISAQQKSHAFVRGIVVAVQKYRVQSPEFTSGGSNPSDAPLVSQYYRFEVAIKVDCKTYVGRYETLFNYLPSAFIADRSIPVRLTRHVMYFDLPNDPDMRMGIVSRRAVCDAKH